MGLFKTKKVEGKNGKEDTVVELDLSGVKNWFNKLTGRDDETNRLYKAIKSDQSFEEIMEQQKIDKMDIISSQLGPEKPLATMERSKTHTHVYDANGICYQCGYQIRNTSEGNGQSTTQTKNVITAIGDLHVSDPEAQKKAKSVLERLEEMVEEAEEDITLETLEAEVPEELEEEKIDFDKVEVTEGIRIVLDSIVNNEDRDIENKALGINAFYNTLTDVDGKLQVIHYLYEKIGEVAEKEGEAERFHYLSALTHAGMEDESDIIDAYLINNVSEAIRILLLRFGNV